MARDPAKAPNRWFEALRRLFRPAADTGQEVQEARESPAQVPLPAAQMTNLFPALGAFLAGQKQRTGGWIRHVAQALPTWAGGRENAPGPARRRADWRGYRSIQAQRRASPARSRFAGTARQFAQRQRARYQATAAEDSPSTMPPPNAPFQPAGLWAPDAEITPGPPWPGPASQPRPRELPAGIAQPARAPAPIEVVTPLTAGEPIPTTRAAAGPPPQRPEPDPPPTPKTGPKALLQRLAAIWRPDRTPSAGQPPAADSPARIQGHSRPERQAKVPPRTGPAEAAIPRAETPPPAAPRPHRPAQFPTAADAPVPPDERVGPRTAPLDSIPKETVPALGGRRPVAPDAPWEPAIPTGESGAAEQREAAPSTAAKMLPASSSAPRRLLLDLRRRLRRPQPTRPATPGTQTAPSAAGLRRRGQALPKQPTGMAPSQIPPASTADMPERIRPEPAQPPQPAGLPLPSKGPATPERAPLDTAPVQSKAAGPVLSQVGLAARTLSQRVQQGLHKLGPGKPLPQASRTFLQRVLGRRVDMLRLHDEAEAAKVTGEIGAAAATVGPHIIVSPTRSRLSGPRGLALLAHEAVHAIQNIEQGPTAEGAPRARRQELEALQAEATVRQAGVPPLRPAERTGPSMPLWQGHTAEPSRQPPQGMGLPGTGGGISPAALSPAPQAVRAVPTAGPLQRTGTATTPTQQSSGAAGDGERQSAPPDLDQLAEEVYRRILYRLNLEREWRGF